ncbi:MAG: hypothetical protein IH946_03950, partial [Bacteroidetes bacterium]|nr:hypothetical protein [Bacteroidota bacterium]
MKCLTDNFSTLNILAFVAFIGLNYQVSAQSSFQSTYGGSAYELGQSLAITADGGYLLFGETESFGAGGKDYYLIKTNSDGTIEWSRTSGGAQDEGGGLCLLLVDSNNYLLTGRTNSFGAGGWDCYLIMVDSLGEVKWTRTYGGSANDHSKITQMNSDSTLMVMGNSVSFSTAVADFFLVKSNKAGQPIWAKSYGNVGEDFPRDIKITQDKGYLMTGYRRNYLGLSWEGWVIKIDSLGQLIWSYRYGGTDDENFFSIESTPDGGMLVTGSTASFGSGSNDV